MRVPPVLSSQLWGLLCGGALGALRTGQAAAHLLAKDRLLQAAGLPALPGAGHAEVLASSAPAWAGALFFGLSLGLGAGSLCAVWCRLTRRLPGRAGRWLPCLVLSLPATALAAGDTALAGTLLAVAAGGLALQRAAPPPRPVMRRVPLLALCAVGLVPWALAPEGPFTRLRDQVLFETPAGLAVDGFYYRWTLYPAEVLKPLAAKTQPLAALSPELAPGRRSRWCAEARRLGVLCVDGAGDAPGFDLTVAPDGAATVLAAGATRLPWPRDTAGQRETWQQFSAARDHHRTLRRATGLALFLGCPLGLCWLLSSAALGLADRCPAGGRARLAAGVLAAALAAAGLGAPGLRDPEVAALRGGLGTSPPATPTQLARHLRSPRPVERFYAARAAPHLGAGAEAPLLDALGDPVVNVRYAAARALGEVGGGAARTALDELLRQPEEWYVKERAYASLTRLGWPTP